MHEQSDIPPEYRDIPLEMLKRGKGRFSEVVLVPQPSDDPNDPLNVTRFAHPKYALDKANGR